MNLGQCIGELLVRIDDLEQGGAKASSKAGGDSAVARLRRELDEAKMGETRALLLVAQERKLREQVERQADAAAARIAQLERDAADSRATKRAEDLAERNANQLGIIQGLKRAVADLEARLRGKDQALSEAQRKLDAAEQRIKGLEAFREHARPAPPVVCEGPVCTAIKHMVLGVAQPQPRAKLGRYEVAPGSVRGVASAIRDVLAKAERPLTSREISERIDINIDKVTTNIPHQLRNGLLKRVDGAPVNGAGGNGYRYWLASRPLPQAEHNEGGAQTC